MRRRFTLRVQIVFFFAALVIAVGGAMAAWDYVQIEKASHLQADESFARAAAAFRQELQAANLAAELELRLVRTAEIVRDRTAWARPAERSAGTVLDAGGAFADVYVGYPDGRFILFRPLRTPEERERYDAPAGARYLAQWIGTPGAPGTFIALDRSWHVLSRRLQPNYRFDPRTRPWYRAARVDRTFTTATYRFATTHQLGYSISLRATNGAIVAADIDLEQLSARLQGVLPSPASLAAVVDPGCIVVALTDGAAFAGAERSAADGRARIAVAAPILATALASGAPVVRDAGGVAWRAFTERIGRSADGPRTLVLAMPERELLASATEARRETILAAALLLVLALPVIWWAAGFISHPLQRLRGEAERLSQLDFREPPAFRSFVTEANHLSAAFATMRRRISRFLALGEQLASERDLGCILDAALAEMVNACQATGGAIRLIEDGMPPAHAGIIMAAFVSREPVEERSDDGAVLAVPLLSRAGDPYGAAVLVREADGVQAFSAASMTYAEAVAGSASIAVEAQRAIASLEAHSVAATRFVPSAFVQLLGCTDIRALQLGDHVERWMIVMFVHLRGIEAALQRAGHEETLTIITDFFASAGPIVRARGGFVDKYVGDMAMVLFPDDAAAAVDAALAIIRDLEPACASWSERFGVPFTVGVGIHAGRLMLGTIGEERRYETTVIADVVNVASRISALTAHFGVALIVSGDVATDLRQPRRRRLGECAVKGAQRPIMLEEIYANDDEPLAAAKDASAARFDLARRIFASGERRAAETIYGEIAAAAPGDRAAAYLRDLCAGGAGDMHDGVLRFTQK